MSLKKFGQIGQLVGCVFVPLVRILLESLSDDRLQHRNVGHARLHQVQGERFLVNLAFERRSITLGHKRRFPRHHFVKQNAQGVEIRAMIGRLSPADLRSQDPCSTVKMWGLHIPGISRQQVTHTEA